MLTEERLKAEIEANLEAIQKLKQIEKDSIAGVEINQIVQKALEEALKELK